MTMIAAWERPQPGRPCRTDGRHRRIKSVPMAHWLAALLAGDDLVLRDATRIRAAGDAVRARHAALADEIDRHLGRLECERICDYCPAFLPAVGQSAQATMRR